MSMNAVRFEALQEMIHALRVLNVGLAVKIVSLITLALF
jgi:hypothetical protein